MNKREQLLAELNKLDTLQGRCQHTFGEVFYDPEIEREEYMSGGYSTQGIHIRYNTSYRDVSIPRWSRVCTKCEFKESTYKTAVEKVKPDFKV